MNVRNEFFFEKLKVYQRIREFAIKLCKIAGSFPVKFSRIRDQLIGAGISVPLNVAEGSGQNSTKEKRNFYKISRRSLFECIPILEISLKPNLINEVTFSELKQEDIELSKMLNGLIRSL